MKNAKQIVNISCKSECFGFYFLCISIRESIKNRKEYIATKSNQIKYSNFYSLQYNVLKLLFINKVNKRGHYIAFLKIFKVECSPNF